MGNPDIASIEAEHRARLDRLAEMVNASKENANRHGERFNIFSILGMQRNENLTHSRYLAELLSPTGRHGEGSRFLDGFVKNVLGITTGISGRIKVTRELATEEQRRVDIVIESTDLIIGIEVKIGAGDQKAQLRDYYKELTHRAKGRKQAVLVYLTLDGKPPSANSLQDLGKENIHCLSFADDIRQWMDKCASLCTNKPELSYALIQYKRLLESLTGAGTTMTSLLADQLTSSRDDMETALAVEKALPRAKSAVMFRFWDELASAMGDAFGSMPEIYGASTLRELSHNYFNSRGGKHVGIKHPIKELDGKTLCLYVNIFNVVHYGLRIESLSGSPVSDPSARDTIRKTLRDGNAVADEKPDWLVCYYHDPSPAQEPVVLNFNSFDGSVLDLIDDENRKVIINNMVEHQVKLAEQARSLLKTAEV